MRTASKSETVMDSGRSPPRTVTLSPTSVAERPNRRLASPFNASLVMHSAVVTPPKWCSRRDSRSFSGGKGASTYAYIHDKNKKVANEALLPWEMGALAFNQRLNFVFGLPSRKSTIQNCFLGYVSKTYNGGKYVLLQVQNLHQLGGVILATSRKYSQRLERQGN